MDVRGRRVTVMGLGRHGGGAAAARYLAAQGAEVTVTDTASSQELRDSLKSLSHVPVHRYRLGKHIDEDFTRAEIVVVNPAVSTHNRFLQMAQCRGAILTTEIQLLIDACPAPVVGVTGTNGKSTTSAMLAHILNKDGRRCFLGGNIGTSLLPVLDQITPACVVVLELSSFQLARLKGTADGRAFSPWPKVAIVTGCTPNHLDWHGSYEAYASAKQMILAGQDNDCLTVLNRFDPQLTSWLPLVRGERLPIFPQEELPSLGVPGNHNRQNAALATTAALGLGCRVSSVRDALVSFSGLPHRMQWVGQKRGRQFINDSMATTPEATMAALRAMERPPWLVAGGYDKGTKLDDLTQTIARLAKGACFYGANRKNLFRCMKRLSATIPYHHEATLEAAVRRCWHQSRNGDSILLSPACASYDQFRDYAHRAREFVRVMNTLLGTECRHFNPHRRCTSPLAQQ